MTDPWLIQNTINYNDKAENFTETKKEVLEQPGSVATRRGVTGANAPHTGGLEFEDNFAPTADANVQPEKEGELKKSNVPHEPLPDSACYLQGLEKKLLRLKKGSKLVEALSEKRQDCLRALLQENSDVSSTAINVLNNNALLELDAPIGNTESTVQDLYRHLQPVQPVTVGETVHIVKYDHLEQQRVEDEAEALNVSVGEEKGAKHSGSASPSN